MKPESLAQLKEIIFQATALPPAERKAYLDEACGEDLELRREAESLLSHEGEPSGILQRAGIIPEAAESEGEAPPIPAEIAGYRIVGKLGEGGMGVVYEAEQESPRRRVALKVVRSGAYLDEHRARLFRREVQALGRLKHPGIAAIYESGCTEAGEHYFVMELVSGVPLDQYQAENPIRSDHARTDIQTRLELFRQICHSINYAHQRGVIHRDLKPSNILVVREEEMSEGGISRGSSIGSSVRVKILDFGLARITDSDVSMTTMMTEVGKIQGTLSYMSPEQARGNPDEIDVRSDVYSLGVILYEMLTGGLPYDVRRTMVHEAVRVIQEAPPRRPSTLIRTLRGDLETIVLKALEKDPERRYQSTAALGEDVGRYLTHQPILARPPSAVYQLRKLVARHKPLFGSLAVVFVVLAGGLIASTTLYLRAERERAESDAVTQFLNDTLASVDPAEARGRQVTVAEMLDQAAEKIGESFPDQPLIEAALRTTIGNTYKALGNYPTAESNLETALDLRKRELGEGHPDTVESMNNLSSLYFEQARYYEKEPWLRQTMDVSRRELGEEHPHTLASMNNLGMLYHHQGRLTEAEPLLAQVLETRRRVLGDEHPETLAIMNDLAMQYQRQYRYDEAEELYTRAFETLRRVKGEEHPWTLIAMVNLAGVYRLQNRFEASEQLLVRGIELQRRVLGEDHSDLYGSLETLGNLDYSQGRYAEAEQHYLEALEGHRRLLGEENTKTLITMVELVGLYIKQGSYDRAEPLCVSTLETIHRKFGEGHGAAFRTTRLLGVIYREQGRCDEAETLFIPVVEGLRLRDRLGWCPENHWQLGWTLLELGRCRTALKRFNEAEGGLLEAYEILNAAPEQERYRASDAIEALIELYIAWGKPEKATEWREMLVEQEAETTPPQPETASE